MTTTTAADAKEGGDDDNVEADDAKGGGGGHPAVKDGNNNEDDDDEKEVMDVMDVLPPLIVRRVERLKYINTDRERVMEQYLEERAALEMTYLDPC